MVSDSEKSILYFCSDCMTRSRGNMVEPATTVAGAIPFTRTCGLSLIGKFANQMIQGCLAGVVGFAAFLGDNRVRGTGQHHRRRQVLIFEYPFSLASEKIISGYVDQERLGPLRIGKLSIGSGHGIDRSGINDDVDSAEFRNRELDSI